MEKKEEEEIKDWNEQIQEWIDGIFEMLKPMEDE
jgi:hypothetical protein|tara:strand:+ start:785 stop:886 length:102 start_codon:yes stop_codon:yes gene_type:complete